MDQISYIKSALKDYRTGAVTPSSSYVIEKVAENVKPDHKYVVEYGPGDGAVTRRILSRLPADGRLLGVEINETMVSELRSIRDPRFRIIHDDVCRIAGRKHIFDFPHIDLAVSSIPLTLITPRARRELVVNTHRHMRDGGTFVVYQYSPLILPLLQKTFRRVMMTLEPRNVLPYFIMIATK